MLGALVTFLALFALIKVFERRRDDVDNFSIATAAIVPVLAVALVAFGLALFYPNPLLLWLVPAIVLIATTFAILWKNLRIPAGRSLAYTTVVVFVNELFAFLLTLA